MYESRTRRIISGVDTYGYKDHSGNRERVHGIKRNIYSVQEVTSLDAEHRVRDRNVLTGLINAMLRQ